MDEQGLLSELLDLAEELGVEVRRDFLGGEGGGICRLRGKWVLFVDSDASVAEQVSRTAEALAGQVGLEDRYILPQVRDILKQYQQKEKN